MPCVDSASAIIAYFRKFPPQSPTAFLRYAEALDEALCFGWIDGQKKIHDVGHWLQKFTRRGPRSVWSKINIAHVERLSVR